MSSIAVRTFQKSDWPDMVRFYEQFYRKDYIFTHRRFFDWNFSSPLNPAMESSQHLLLNGQKIIGMMGALPWPLQWGSQRAMGEYNINLFIDPEYRGHNLGQTLLDAVSTNYRHSLTNGYNPRTLSIYQRIGCVYHWLMKRFIKCLAVEDSQALLKSSPLFMTMPIPEQKNAINRLRESAAISGSQKVSLKRVNRFGEPWDNAWNQISNRYGFTTRRNSHFLNWRYIDYPFPSYECYLGTKEENIVGLLVLRHEDSAAGKVTRIVDLVCQKEAFIDLLGSAERLGRQNQSIFIDIYFGGLVDDKPLHKAGYCQMDDPEGHPLLPMDFNPLRHRDAINTLILFKDPTDQGKCYLEENNYYIVKGDGDQDRAN